MRIELSPQRCDGTLTVEKNGDIITINGEPFDFRPVTEGATIKAENIPSEWICGDLSRNSGELTVCLALPHGPDPADCVAFPAPIENPPDGVIDLPFTPYSTTTEQVVEGGRNVTTTRYEWGTDAVTTTHFAPDPPSKAEETEERADVDA